MNAAAFDPLRILKALHRRDVRFVIIGGIVGRLWESTTVTNDLDVCYARDRANLQWLALALRDLKAKGDTATSMNLGEITAPVAAIEDLILVKRASARPKDLVEVQFLAAVRDEMERK
jgi:hypothetical protein